MMHQASATCLLDANIAVALRLIRSGQVPRRYFLWLANPGSIQPTSRETETVSMPIRESMEAIFNPILEDAEPWEQRETQNAPQWLASISQYVAECYGVGQMGFAMRLYAMSLLPMYRTLATGNLHEGFLQTRHRLAECLAMLGICKELMRVSDDDPAGNEILEIFEASFRDKLTPNKAVEEHLNLDLPCVGRALCVLSSEFDAQSEDFLPTVRSRIEALSDQSPTPAADWADSGLLWRLAGELISKKSEMVLPRPWIDTPVPWSSIGDHWNQLSLLLSTPNWHASDEPASAKSKSLSAPTSTSLLAVDPQSQGVEKSSELSGEGQAPACGTRPTSETSQEWDNADPHGEESNEAVSEELSENLCENDADADAGSVALATRKSAAAAATEVVVPKVMLAEIRSHNDPVFVNVLKRQIANCRADERSVCMATIVVQPEHETDRADVCSIRDNGLTLWQQKLVNWIADQDNVVEPYAFLTSDGELILCVLDLERNEMTSTLRKGLIEVLTGERVEDAGDLSLAKVAIPARFHAGIAATSSPGANFSPQQLIEPAIRCLSAASRQGKASIKSIEVF